MIIRMTSWPLMKRKAQTLNQSAAHSTIVDDRPGSNMQSATTFITKPKRAGLNVHPNHNPPLASMLRLSKMVQQDSAYPANTYQLQPQSKQLLTLHAKAA